MFSIADRSNRIAMGRTHANHKPLVFIASFLDNQRPVAASAYVGRKISISTVRRVYGPANHLGFQPNTRQLVGSSGT